MKKRTLVFGLILSVLISLLVIGCGGNKVTGDNTSQQQSAKKVTIKLGHPYDEKQPLHLGAVRFAETVKKQTNGRIEITIFANNTLGSSRDLTEGVQMSTIDMALVPTTNVATFYDPINIFYFPFIFENKEHAYKVSDGPIGEKLYEGLRNKTGIQTLAMFESGFRTITNSKREIKAPNDLKGIKMRVTDSPINLATFKALGANSTPMALGEVFTGLQLGTVDGQDNPIGNVYASRYYEVQKYITLTQHQWAGIMMIINDKRWGTLSAEDQKILMEAAKEAQGWERTEINKQESGYLKEMEKAGMKVTTLTPEEKKVFQDKMQPVWTEYEGKLGKDLVTSVINAK